jgi:hypothetical protein
MNAVSMVYGLHERGCAVGIFFFFARARQGDRTFPGLDISARILEQHVQNRTDFDKGIKGIFRAFRSKSLNS